MSKYITKCEGGYKIDLGLMESVTKSNAMLFTANTLSEWIVGGILKQFEGNMTQDIYAIIDIVMKSVEVAKMSVADFREELQEDGGYDIEFDMEDMKIFIPEERVEKASQIQNKEEI